MASDKRIKQLRPTVLERDNYTCVYCDWDGRRDPVMLVMDHVRPRARGGKSSLRNLATACSACNARKGALSVVQFLDRYPTLPAAKRLATRHQIAELLARPLLLSVDDVLRRAA